ncbi:LuxR C-terminal-related transcriptional regulator [Kitasatospora gansuensis]
MQGYVLVDPQYAGARLEANFFSISALMLEQAASISDAFKPLRATFDSRAADAAGLIEQHRGSEAIGWRMGQILSGCSTEILCCQPGAQRRPEAIQEASTRDLAALRRGVAMRTIYHEQARTGAGMDLWVSTMTAAGADIRTLDAHFERMFIIDRRIAVIPGDHILVDSTDAVAYVVNDPGIAAFLARQFERDWEQSTPWNDPGKAPLALTTRQAAILRGLEAGTSREKLAHQVGISLRTLAVAVSELKDHFGVKSAFELACCWKEWQAAQGAARS